LHADAPCVLLRGGQPSVSPKVRSCRRRRLEALTLGRGSVKAE
jgi:hypothetical protein